MTPNQLAEELGISPKRLRQWLRDTYKNHVPYERWYLSERQVREARWFFLT